MEWYQRLKSQGNTENANECTGSFYLPEGWDSNPLINVPDVFIYLCINQQPVAYRRVALSEITNWDGPKWYDMKRNMALNKYKDDVFPGALLIALNCGPKSDGNHVEQDHILSALSHAAAYDVEPSHSSTSQRPTHFNVTIQCKEATGLPAMDKIDGELVSSDPFVVITVRDESGGERNKETKKIKKTLNPKWNQDLVFENCKFGDSLRLSIVDWNWGLYQNEGMCFIEPRKLDGESIEGLWLPLLPSDEVKKNHRNKMDQIKGMKIKIGIKYESVDWEEEEKWNKEFEELGMAGRFVRSITDHMTGNLSPKEPKPEIGRKLVRPNRKPMQLKLSCCFS